MTRWASRSLVLAGGKNRVRRPQKTKKEEEEEEERGGGAENISLRTEFHREKHQGLFSFVQRSSGFHEVLLVLIILLPLRPLLLSPGDHILLFFDIL